MNNRHLPAGQAVEGGGAAGVAMGNSGPGPGPGPNPRRGGRSQYQSHYSSGGHQNQHHHQHQHMQQHQHQLQHQQHPHQHQHQHQHHQQQQQAGHAVYANYMNPYAGYGYPHAPPGMPPPYQNGAQYQAGGIPGQAYMPYPHYNARSPPPPMLNQYVHMMGAGTMPAQHQPPPQAYPRNQQQSPIVVSSPYQTPPVSTRASSQSHQTMPQLPQTQTPSQAHSSQTPSQTSAQSIPGASPQPQPQPQREVPSPEVPAVVSPTDPTTAPTVASSAPLPQTPSSTHSTQAQEVAAPPMTPPTPHTDDTPGDQVPSPKPQPQVKLASPKAPFRAPLPWFSHTDFAWPARAKTKKRRRITGGESMKLPPMGESGAQPEQQEIISSLAEQPIALQDAAEGSEGNTKSTPSKSIPQAEPSSSTPSTQDQPSIASTSPTTPSSVKATPVSAPATAPTAAKTVKPAARAAVPAVPIVPVLPKAAPKEVKPSGSDKPHVEEAKQSPQASESVADKTVKTTTAPAEGAPVATEAEAKPKPAPAPAAPLLWTGLFAKSSALASASGASQSSQAGANGATGADSSAGNRAVNAAGFAQFNASSLAEALRAYRVGSGEKISFIEPRGLINTGNMCYMNSVLQVLVSCVPFFDFLEQVSKKLTHSFKSETPLIDSMIEFMRDFKVIDSAVSVEQLRRRLKNDELEQYGEPFTPEFVYEAIKKLPRFSTMRRGHQQDAEEFLGFLLESLHDECAQIMRAAPLPSSNASTAPNSSAPTPTASVSSATLDGGDSSNVWLEVGPRQRPAITRSSGHSDTSSPITKIFGGQLRSELRVPGLKDSVTLEPYQPLQLDIGSPQVRNIVDALRGLTNPESLRGDFKSPRGKDVTATKQVFIESLPPILILHLKRFQFDAEGNGTVKIWKKIGYPLELEIPREVFTRSKRNNTNVLPRYKLTAVVYHHGKNASGGHYTVDVRRQDGMEWIRLDDTVIRRIRSEDVAEGGVEEEPSKSLSDPSSRKETTSGFSASGPNRFASMGGDDEAGDEDGWKQVNTPANGGKKWSSVVNGSAQSTPTRSKQLKDNIKDNKVAYLLFYQRV